MIAITAKAQSQSYTVSIWGRGRWCPGTSLEGQAMWEVLNNYRWIVLLVVLATIAYFLSVWAAVLVAIPAAAIMIGQSMYRAVVRRNAAHS